MDTLTFDTPLGPMTLLARDDAIVGAFFVDQPNAVRLDGAPAAADSPLLRRARDELLEYFAGKRRRFELPLAPVGTPFQRAVWEALGRIPCGDTLGYASLARQIGRERAVRAVAGAVARNPLMLLVPCHRVLGAGGRLTGFSAGLARKQALLTLERTATASCIGKPPLPGSRVGACGR